ncbi:MAG: F0F1 ATP synthase subunit B [Patescibacteria group bacterium]
MQEIIGQFGLDPKIFIAEIINFLIILGILYYFIFRKISQLLDERSETIREGVENAEQAQATLEKAEAEKMDILQKAGEEASQEIKQAVDTAKKREADIIMGANTRAEEILKEAEHKGEHLKEKLVHSSQDEIAKMVVLGAEKILREQ